MADWYVKRGDRVIGPISVHWLERMARDGKVRPDDLVRKDDGPYRNADQYTGLITDSNDEFDEEDDHGPDWPTRQEFDRPLDAGALARGPALAFYFLCSGWILFIGYWLVKSLRMPDGMWVDDQVDRVLRQIVGNIGMLGMIFTNILVLLGAVCLHIRRYYWLAMLGSIISMLPLASPVFCLGMPVGLWAIIVLVNPDVKDDFRRA